MTLLVGTRTAVHRLPGDDPGAAEAALSVGGKVYDLAAGDGRVYAATAEGVYRSADGREWTGAGLDEFATAVAVAPGGTAYAGTMPAAVYRSAGGGEWERLGGFDAVPSREQWWNPDVTPHTRALAVPPDRPDRVYAGVDGGGVHASDDRGAAWTERRGGVASFVHDLHLRGGGEVVAAGDAGLFRTRDGGEWWDYLYGDATEHRYFRGVFGHGDAVFSGGARSHPPVWGGERGADAGLYRVRFRGRELDVARVPYPGEPQEVVLGGTVADGDLLAGTNECRLLRRRGAGDWATAGVLDGEEQVRCMLAV